MATIGVVCEGSHDFFFLKPVIEKILSDRGHHDSVVSPLQPAIDATSSQVGQGGYVSVIQWIANNGGPGLSKFFQPALFRTSIQYDAIILHVDGDIPEICEDFKLSPYFGHFADIDERVFAISSWLLSFAKIEPAFSSNMIAAIPVLQTEAWVIGALRPGHANIETRNLKKATKRILFREFRGSGLHQVKRAGSHAAGQIPPLCSTCLSFGIFYNKIVQKF